MNEQKEINAEDLGLEQLAPGEESGPIERKRDDNYQHAKEHMAESLAEAQLHKQVDEAKTRSIVVEIAVIAGVYVLIWLAISILHAFADISTAWMLLDCLTPAALGIGWRVLREKQSFGEAFSACKLHLAASALLLLVWIVRLVIGY